MKIEELKDRIKDEISIYWERTQNSTLYIQLKEQYEELNPNIQKLLQISAFVFVLYIIFSFPLAWMNEANQDLAKYKKNRTLIEDLLKIQNEMKSQPNIDIDINPSSLLVKATSAIQKTGLSEKQMGDTKVLSPTEKKLSFLPKTMTYKGIQIELKQLNLNQIIDIGNRMQNLTTSTKLIDMEILQNSKDDHYYDVKFFVAGFTGVDVEN